MGKNFDYRQFYKDYYGIEFGDDYVVHHIDMDKTNNDIRNLLLLPKSLYAKYNLCVTALGGMDNIKNLDFAPTEYQSGTTDYQYKMLINLCEALIEVNNWACEKAVMDFKKIN